MNRSLNLTLFLALRTITKPNDLKKLEKYREALSAYDEAIEREPIHSSAYFNKGIVLEELKSDNAAIESYKKCIEINTDNDEAHYNKGVVLTKMGDIQEAENAL